MALNLFGAGAKAPETTQVEPKPTVPQAELREEPPKPSVGAKTPEHKNPPLVTPEPQGRAPGVNKAKKEYLARLAREYTLDALNTLVEVATNPLEPAAARVSASNAILDRGYGRVKQIVTLEEDEAAEQNAMPRIAISFKGKKKDTDPDVVGVDFGDGEVEEMRVPKRSLPPKAEDELKTIEGEISEVESDDFI